MVRSAVDEAGVKDGRHCHESDDRGTRTFAPASNRRAVATAEVPASSQVGNGHTCAGTVKPHTGAQI